LIETDKFHEELNERRDADEKRAVQSDQCLTG